MKLAVLFPGIGYTCDKPLMYYSGKLARALGYDVRPVPYTGFPKGVKGSPEGMRRSFALASEQAEALLGDVRWDDYESLLLIGKSIGTAVALRFAREHGLTARSVLFTPLAETFIFETGEAIAFHGTADPWAETPAIEAACRSRGIPLYLTEGANHSLETGAVEVDIRTLAITMDRVSAFIGQ